jgi:branched-chain amino acid transport system ATP-binding protein
VSALLRITGLRAAYGKIVALKGVDLEVNRGEIVALIGSNGAGKSTLMMSIFGRPRAQAGHIVFDGQDITHVPTHAIARLRISQAPEGRRIFPRMSVMENLQMGADATDGGADRQAELHRVLSLFPILQERLTQRGGTLSGGEQQMLAIGRALMSRPRLLLLDEPSLGLAPMLVREIAGAIETINREDRVSVILVEQNSRMALRISSHAYVLETGRVALAGPSAELVNDDHVRRLYLGG